jgi:Uncharacterized protein conserved in bacteria (DUF2213)
VRRLQRRLDLGELAPPVFRDDGTVRVQGHLTRCGVFSYRQPDGSIRRELRLPEDVFDPASMGSFSGVPVTNDHPQEMIDASNARKYAVGALMGTPGRDDDHMIGELAVYDGDTVAGWKQGKKRQLSLGYVCDLAEEPGVHPEYGPYDARQLNIRGNHCALVDAARAGQTAAIRLDAAEIVIDSGTGLALCESCAKISVMSKRSTADAKDDETKPYEGKQASADPDKGDVAHRSAKGENDAKAGDKDSAKDAGAGAEEEGVQDAKDSKEQTSSRPGKGGKPDPKTKKTIQAADPDDDDEKAVAEKDDDDDDDMGAEEMDSDDDDDDDDDEDDDDDDDDEERDDAYTTSLNKDGELTAEARDKLKSSSFAVPAREGLPMFDPEHLKAAMSRFSQYDFKNPGEQHRAFNLIQKRAKHFGVSSEGFDKAHRPTLDAKDRDTMPSKKTQNAIARADKAEASLAAAEGKIAGLEKDLELARGARTDSVQVDEKLNLLLEARGTGAKVDAKMSAVEIKRAVVKHVDGIEVPASKPEPYVDALYESSIRRYNQDAEETVAGAQALANVRAVAAAPAINDEEDCDEEAAYARAAERNDQMWASVPERFMTKRAKEQF